MDCVTPTPSKRPRGFIDVWTPQKKTRQLLEQVDQELSELFLVLPITIRQLFYRLVAKYEYPKSEKAYKSLGEVINRARRSQRIDMDSIRDDVFRLSNVWYFSDPADFWQYTQNLAEGYETDRQAGQDRRLLVWCEAQGMVPQLERVCRPYGVRVASSGGFDSTTSKHAIGKQLSSEPTTVIHLGDFDPSGKHMFGSLDEDVTAFCDYYGGDVEFTRLAVLSEHIDEYDLPTSPPKETDNRSFDGDETVQLEAIDPSTLAELVQEAITNRLDMELYEEVLETEEKQRNELVAEVESNLDQ